MLEERAVHAGRRLVEQNEVRIGHERARDLEQLLLPIGEAPAVFGAQVAEVDEGDEGERPLAGDPVGYPEAGHRQHVLEHGHLAEDA
jgi:hypothetical protein